MNQQTREKADKVFELLAKAKSAAHEGKPAAADAMVADAQALTKAVVKEPEFRSEDPMAVVREAELEGLSPLRKSCRKPDGYGKIQIDSEHQAFQEWNDKLLVLLRRKAYQEMRKGIPARAFHPLELDSKWARNTWMVGKARFATFIKAEMDAMKKANAYYTSATSYGAEWIPTLFSREIIDVVHLAFQVPSIFRQVEMQSNPFTTRIFTGDIHFQKGSENTSTSPSRVPAVDKSTGSVTFNAVLFDGRVTISMEAEEDALISLVNEINRAMAKAYPMDLEDAIINGDKTWPHPDSDVTETTDRRTSWYGLRYHALTDSKKVDLSTFSLATLLTVPNQLSANLQSRADCVWIFPPKITRKLVALDPNQYVPVNDYAPLFKGEVGKLDGSPVIETEKLSLTLNASGYVDITSGTKAGLLYVNKNAFALGNWKGIEVLTIPKAEYDVMFVVGRGRCEFLKVQGSAYYPVAYGYNIA